LRVSLACLRVAAVEVAALCIGAAKTLATAAKPRVLCLIVAGT
jgi:hypothetical protein